VANAVASALNRHKRGRGGKEGSREKRQTEPARKTRLKRGGGNLHESQASRRKLKKYERKDILGLQRRPRERKLSSLSPLSKKSPLRTKRLETTVSEVLRLLKRVLLDSLLPAIKKRIRKGRGKETFKEG